MLSSEPHIISAPNEYKLNSPPSDGISSVQFAPEGSKFLLVTSWDCSVRLYEVNANAMRLSYMHSAPVLDCAFIDVVRCASGGLDCLVKVFDFNTNSETVLGMHDAAVRNIEFASDVGTLITGSWDSSVKLWDVRTPRCLGTYEQPDKVYTMSTCGDKVIVGTAGRKVWVWDLRNMNGPEQKRESSLKYQTRCIRAFPNRSGYVLCSIEGRAAVEFLDPHPDVQRRKYAFKCHRVRDDTGNGELIYPVNAVAFHPHHNTFATGGSDCFVNVWDPFNKKRLCQFHKYPTSISSLAFSPDGSTLAIAASYQYEEEEEMHPLPEDTIFIRKVTDQETKPKT